MSTPPTLPNPGAARHEGLEDAASVKSALDVATQDEGRRETTNGGRIEFHLPNGTRLAWSDHEHTVMTQRSSGRVTLWIAACIVGAAVLSLFQYLDARTNIHDETSENVAVRKSSTHVVNTAVREDPHERLPHSQALAASQGDCCRVCRRGQPCGDACVSSTAACHEPPGCACDGNDTRD